MLSLTIVGGGGVGYLEHRGKAVAVHHDMCVSQGKKGHQTCEAVVLCTNKDC